MKFLTMLIFVFFSLPLEAQSVLSTGQWFKFSVEREGVYKISAGQLRDAGLDIGKVNPKNLKLYGGCFGMLPQPNRADRINALQEMAITVAGEDDGAFNDSDYILFYGQNPDRFKYNPAKNIYDYENNYFTDTNFYFLTVAAGTGKRIPTPAPVAGSFPVVSRFSDFAYWEKDSDNLLNTGRQWFGEVLSRSNNYQTFTYKIPGIVPDTDIKFVSQIAVKGPEDNCSFDISINDHLIKTQTVPRVSGVEYDPIANIVIDTVVVNSSAVQADGGVQSLKYYFKPGGGGTPIGYLDFHTFTFIRTLAQYSDQTFFSSGESMQQATSTFNINNAGGQSVVWDVTDSFNVVKETLSLNGSQGSFNASTSTLKRFVVFNGDKIDNANFVKKVANQDLASLSGIQYLVITHEKFLEQAKRLADYRASSNNLKTAVATVEEIYNEYSGGKQDITALRDFIHGLYWNSNKGLKSVLLFGKASYDYRNIQKAGNHFVPIYESRESVGQKTSYASDDYLGMMAIEQGEWPENGSARDSVAIGLGRIPVKTAAEAQVVVDKIMEYEKSADRLGCWRSSFLFVADDGDAALHMQQSNDLAKSIETKHNEFIVKRLYLDNFQQIHSSTGQSSPAMYNAFAREMDKGYAVINYTGHGSTRRLTTENILDWDWIPKRKNAPRYPLFITATCDFGRNDNPTETSAGERLLLLKGGGIIGLVSSVRPVLANNNFKLNVAFYDGLFKLDGAGKYRTLGAVFKASKNNGVDAINGRNYIYLGDPGLTLPFPDKKIVLSSIKNSTNSPDLQALSQITVAGRVANSGNPPADYAGKLHYIVFDRPVTVKTKGDINENDPFTYYEWANRLAEGTASVKNGEFQFDMILSKNYGTTGPAGYPDQLKLYFYSNDNDKTVDFSGYDLKPPVKEINPKAPVDNTPPTIKLYINDSTFANGGTVGTSAKFIALLSDEHGINASFLDPDTKLRMDLDGETYDTFEYSTNDNDYTKGRIDFLMSNLELGKHTITLYAADTYGNKARADISFNVSSKLAAGEFCAFPNPAKDQTKFTFTCSQIGEEMDGIIEIFSTIGQRIAELPIKVNSGNYRIVLNEWDLTVNGKKIDVGLYLARLTLRSLGSSATTQQSTRLAVYY